VPDYRISVGASARRDRVDHADRTLRVR